MDWKNLFKVLIRSALSLTVLGATVLGGIGFLLAGKDGLVSGITWGVILSIVSAPFFGMMFTSKFWGDFSARHGS